MTSKGMKDSKIREYLAEHDKMILRLRADFPEMTWLEAYDRATDIINGLQAVATMTRCQAYDQPLDGFRCSQQAVCCPQGCQDLTDTCLEHMDERNGQKMCQECCYEFDRLEVIP